MNVLKRLFNHFLQLQLVVSFYKNHLYWLYQSVFLLSFIHLFFRYLYYFNSKTKRSWSFSSWESFVSSSFLFLIYRIPLLASFFSVESIQLKAIVVFSSLYHVIPSLIEPYLPHLLSIIHDILSSNKYSSFYLLLFYRKDQYYKFALLSLTNILSSSSQLEQFLLTDLENVYCYSLYYSYIDLTLTIWSNSVYLLIKSNSSLSW